MQQAPVARGRAHWTFATFMLVALLGLFVLREFTTPDPRGHGTHEQLGLPPCMMMEFVGVPCPGCGVTTAMSSFAHGEILAAFVVQPFGALLAVLLVVLAAIALVDTIRGRDAWAGFRGRWKPWMSWVLGGAMLAAWAYKIVALRA